MNNSGMSMRLMSLALLAAAAFALAAAPAEAATKKRSQSVAAQSAERGESGAIVRRSRTRITVTRRSYLDAGTEVYPGSQPYTDYVFSPSYHRPSDIADPTRSFTSLPPPFWIPSYHVPNWGY